MPDLYIDELQEMLSMSCGQDVSRATVWQVLHKGGYTLKKVSDSDYFSMSTLIVCRLHGLQQNVRQKSGLSTSLGLENMKQISWSSLMKAQLIAGRHIVVGLGPFEGLKHSVRRSLCVEDGA
jgi:hypothetical protein